MSTREDYLTTAVALGSGVLATEEQERRDQQMIANNPGALPYEMEPAGAKAFLEKAGVKFLCQAESSFRFWKVELPNDWTIIPGNHPWMTLLLDNKKRERAKILYKGADNWYVLVVLPRYGILERGYSVGEKLDKSGPIFVTITDGGIISSLGNPIHQVEAFPLTDFLSDRYRSYRNGHILAKVWLDYKYPEWQNPFAYWD